MNNYIAPGVTRPWTNGTGSNVSSGDVVVVGQQIAIACVDIADTETGEVQYTGRFSVAKVSAAVIADGEMVMWDSSASAFDDNAATPASGDVTNAASAVGAWAATTTTMEIQLADRIGTVA
jgi:predicted RecA/RadA family phage recombinase